MWYLTANKQYEKYESNKVIESSCTLTVARLLTCFRRRDARRTRESLIGGGAWLRTLRYTSGTLSACRGGSDVSISRRSTTSSVCV